MLVEVLSKSTEEYDKNDKFLTYRHISTFQEYVLISQNRPVVQQFNSSNGRKMDIIKATIGLNSEVYFESVDIELSLEDIYDLIEFEKEI